MVELHTQIDYENIIHDLICKMLPKMPKSNIRPTHYNDSPVLKNIISDSHNDGMDMMNTQDTFIYFTVQFLPQSEPYIYPNNIIDNRRLINISFSIYSSECELISTIILALFKTQFAISTLANAGLFIYTVPTADNSTWEDINGEWWKRQDFDIQLNECVEVVNTEPESDAEGIILNVIGE